MRIPKKKAQARLITISDIDSFSKVRLIGKKCGYTRMAESTFKNGVARILGEKGPFEDWEGRTEIFLARGSSFPVSAILQHLLSRGLQERQADTGQDGEER